MCCSYCTFFFFRQKTAYEMRISDWSSDVCSSDLATHLVMENPDSQPRKRLIAGAPVRRTARHVRVCATQYDQRRIANFDEFAEQIEYFASTAASYDSHLLLFPEYVSAQRSEEHTSELQSLMRISYAVFCLKKKKQNH